jgi:hypothetical protein
MQRIEIPDSHTLVVSQSITVHKILHDAERHVLIYEVSVNGRKEKGSTEER